LPILDADLVTGAATAAQLPTRFRDRSECRFASEFLPKNKLSIAQNYASNELCRIGISAQDMGVPLYPPIYWNHGLSGGNFSAKYIFQITYEQNLETIRLKLSRPRSVRTASALTMMT
jgi:hypothetical protein